MAHCKQEERKENGVACRLVRLKGVHPPRAERFGVLPIVIVAGAVSLKLVGFVFKISKAALLVFPPLISCILHELSGWKFRLLGFELQLYK